MKDSVRAHCNILGWYCMVYTLKPTSIWPSRIALGERTNISFLVFVCVHMNDFFSLSYVKQNNTIL